MGQRLPISELVSMFRQADLFVFASNIEYSPLVLYETAAAGTPFLTVPVGNSAEIAQWTGAGLICPANMDVQGFTRVDPNVLAEAMTDAMLSPKRLNQMGQTGRQRWRQYFTWQKISTYYEAALRGEKVLSQDFMQGTE